MRKITWMTALVTTFVAGGALLTAGCDGGDADARSAASAQAQPAPASPAQAEALPPSLFAQSAPADAKDVAAAKSSAKAGDAIVLRGKIGGSAEPLAANRALMTITDLSLPTCSDIPGDKCKTPWDSCCEPADDVAAKSATVQVVGADGRPLKASLNGAHGIAPGKKVVVQGKVKSAADNTLVVDATQIAVSP
ncbi:MAG TPA: hypothetical protein VER17_02960 [Tepidisphaeraceae bacterium]|nr:hypothetical protein [Tepidisphaeraceae bacterium]